MTAGNVASRPNAFVSRTADPRATPSSTDTFQNANSATPQAQNADRRRCGEDCRSANATDSSVITCVPSSRASQRLTAGTAPPPAVAWPAGADHVRDREPVGEQPGVQHRAREHGRDRGPAGEHHADRRDLRAAREDEHGKRDGHPPGQPAADAGSAERHGDDPVRQADERRHRAAAPVRLFAIQTACSL